MNIFPHKIQIETTSSCNQRCYFCPVSIQKRPKHTLSVEQLNAILQQIPSEISSKIYLNGFNEPTYDKDIAEKVSFIKQQGHEVSFLSNGSGLNAALTDKLLTLGVNEFTLNLSTIDDAQYKTTRGNHDITRVLPNVAYLLKNAPEQCDISILVLGQLDQQHCENIQQIHQYFKGFLNHHKKIVICPAVDYAANHTHLNPHKIYHKQLKGCISQRHNEWFHITAAGNVILCCQDYDEKYSVGNIANDRLVNIFNNIKFDQLRQQVDGVISAPADFICRSCIFALAEDNYKERLERIFCQNCKVKDGIYGQKDACSHCIVKQE